MPTRRHRARRKLPSYKEEAGLLEQGYVMVAGVDEAGRGPLAGPVVAGAVVLPPNPKGRWVRRVRDSKEMTALERNRVYGRLRQVALGIEAGSASEEEIDEIGIVPATQLAMKRAIVALALQPQFLILDAITVPELDVPQRSIIDGDALCLSIAAASIVAKVTRDRFMVQQHERYPGYGFLRNKGYATAEHLRRLRSLGPCPLHRYTFAPIKGWGLSR